jgi:hypothetical protein
VESELSRQRARRHITRPAEGGEKVVECRLVGDVDRRETQTPLVAFPMKEVVISYAEIE